MTSRERQSRMQQRSSKMASRSKTTILSLSSFNLTHTNGNKEDYATISLYKKRPGTENREDILIASINSDLNGNHIVLPAGQTTNLLIDLCQEINVRVKISPWDKTEQWVEW